MIDLYYIESYSKRRNLINVNVLIPIKKEGINKITIKRSKFDIVSSEGSSIFIKDKAWMKALDCYVLAVDFISSDNVTSIDEDIRLRIKTLSRINHWSYTRSLDKQYIKHHCKRMKINIESPIKDYIVKKIINFCEYD